jgi:hypothetical protein
VLVPRDLWDDAVDMASRESEPLSTALQQEMTEAFREMPAVPAADAEGREGPIDIPPDQISPVMERQLEIMLKYVPQIAAELDFLKARVDRLAGE